MNRSPSRPFLLFIPIFAGLAGGCALPHTAGYYGVGAPGRGENMTGLGFSLAGAKASSYLPEGVSTSLFFMRGLRDNLSIRGAFSGISWRGHLAGAIHAEGRWRFPSLAPECLAGRSVDLFLAGGGGAAFSASNRYFGLHAGPILSFNLSKRVIPYTGGFAEYNIDSIYGFNTLYLVYPLGMEWRFRERFALVVENSFIASFMWYTAKDYEFYSGFNFFTGLNYTFGKID